MKCINYILFGIIGWLFTSCSQVGLSDSDAIRIENGRFVDAQKRTIIWNGLNLVEKDPNKGYVQDIDEELFIQFKEWGINCVRYGIHWDGLEPEPGIYNENYLAELDKRVRWARENNIYLVLDMHQDLYSRKFGNGAPVWATLDEGLPHVTGKVWSDAYLMSPGVQKSFDNFWLNTPASDGIGIQDHYISTWKKLAERYADSTSVLGFDIMNEPFIGSDAPQIFQELLKGFANYMVSQGMQISSEAEIGQLWMDDQKRSEALSLVDDGDAFRFILKHAEQQVNQFEENQLSTFYQKVRDTIRSTGNNKILFLEHNYFCNLGIESSFHFPVTENGDKDELCAYAPHAYDLVVDTEGATHPGFKRLDTIFERIMHSAQHRKVPILLGEWGAFYMGSNYAVPALHHMKWIEQSLAGHTYWSWWTGIETQDYFHYVIARPYPQCVNGELIKYHFDAQTKSFTCIWEENESTAPTQIFIPDMSLLSKENVQLSPLSSFEISRISEKSKGGYLLIKPVGKKRELRIVL